MGYDRELTHLDDLRHELRYAIRIRVTYSNFAAKASKHTLHRSNYIHGSRFVVFCCCWIMVEFTLILQEYLTGVGQSKDYQIPVMQNVGKEIMEICRILLEKYMENIQRSVQIITSLPFYGIEVQIMGSCMLRFEIEHFIYTI